MIIDELVKAENIGVFSVLNKKIRPRPTRVYDTYWKFAVERQNIFFRRFSGQLPPWTMDKILHEYKFTNVYRASDRVSQHLIKSVIKSGPQDPSELFFRIILFKIFNRISTWEFLEAELGEINFRTYSFSKYNKLLSELMERKIPIYSAAYIMASGSSAFGLKRKHQNHLKLIEMMMKEGMPQRMERARSLEHVYGLLLKYPTIGEFLAFQYAIDLNYSPLVNFSEMQFVKAGPGAKDGIAKCFKSLGEYSHEDVIKMSAEDQDKEFDRLGLSFKSLWGRKLQLIDCQNLYCEVDKYARIAHPRIAGLSGRTRIKQKYERAHRQEIQYVFPEKWGINNLIPI